MIVWTLFLFCTSFHWSVSREYFIDYWYFYEWWFHFVNVANPMLISMLCTNVDSFPDCDLLPCWTMMPCCTLNQTVSFKPKKQKSQKFSVTPKLFPGWRFSEAQFLHLHVDTKKVKGVFMSFLCYSVHHVISRLLIGQHFYMARVLLPSVACACLS